MLSEIRCTRLCGKLGWDFVANLENEIVVKIDNKKVKIPWVVFEKLDEQQTYIEDFESSPEGFERYSCGC